MAIASVGTGHLASPRPWITSPLVWLVDDAGTVKGTVGKIEDAGGRYVSSVVARTAIGHVTNDSLLLVASLASATLQFYDLRSNSTPLVGMYQLPLYMSPPAAWEDVWRTPWLDVGGEHVRTYSVAQLADVTFGPDGRMWIIRNGDVKWDSRDSQVGRQVYARSGNWRVNRQWLEIYSPTAKRLGAYEVSSLRPRSIIADSWGGVFVLGAGGIITMIRDPGARGSETEECPAPRPSELVIKSVDRPYGGPGFGRHSRHIR